MERKGLYLSVAQFPSWANIFFCILFKRTSCTSLRKKMLKHNTNDKNKPKFLNEQRSHVKMADTLCTDVHARFKRERLI